MKPIVILTTGGTIEKTYDPVAGTLDNTTSITTTMLSRLVLGGPAIEQIPLMNKDSLKMTPEDHQAIVAATDLWSKKASGIVVLHGTDRLATTGCALHEHRRWPIPIVLTGAMRPFALRNSDAMQNLTESLLAVQILSPAVYCVFHNRALPFPNVAKDSKAGTFIDTSPATPIPESAR